MPWIALYDDDEVVPEMVDDGVVVRCPECGGEMYPRGPSSDGRSRHFYHPASGGGGGSTCSGAGGEAAIHRKMKSMAVSKLRQVYGSVVRDSVDVEAPFDVSQTESEVDMRRADALVTFAENHARLGRGLIVEVQYRNEGKDKSGVVADYHQRGYSVVWADEDDFSEDRCLIEKEEFEDRAISVFPNAVPEFSDWTTVEFDLRCLNQRRRQRPPMATFLDETRSEWARRITTMEYGLDVEPMPSQEVKLPVEWYGDRARERYRDADWDRLFDSAEEGHIIGPDPAPKAGVPRQHLDAKPPARELFWRLTPWAERFRPDEGAAPLRAARQEWRRHDDADLERGAGVCPATFHLPEWAASGQVLTPGGISSPEYLLIEAKQGGETPSEAVDRVARIIEYNTGDPQPDTISREAIGTIATSYCDIDPDAVHGALYRLVKSGIVEVVNDEYRIVSGARKTVLPWENSASAEEST